MRAVPLGGGLQPAGRERLTTSLVANTTGDATIRAGVPAGWLIGGQDRDRSTGRAQRRRDRAAPGPRAAGLAVYADPDDPESTAGNATIAEATTIAVRRLVGQ
ncbi:hypothetical protein ACGH52_34610 [Streptomyces sp. BBFR25]|uniref:hypothetical protein n=1 Tax=Streptomyces sp. BBFR25 TaxID=3372855 RepID=UPI0037DC6132